MGKDGLVCEATILPMSELAERTRNELRDLVETLDVPACTEEKPMIHLSIGDPTTHGNLKAPQIFVDEIAACARDFKLHGYQHSTGMLKAREAIACKYSYTNTKLTATDVIIASGCSGALDIAIKALASPGDNILVPRPCFGLYKAMMKSCGIEFREYGLLPERMWEADIEALEAQVTPKTRAILVNNPSNPCGSVYREEHLRKILEVAERHNLPILADEIYGDIVFDGNKFYPVASLTDSVPILCVGGISKEYLVPGLRIGWVLCYNHRGMLKNVWQGANRICALLLGGNSIVQAALPRVLCSKSGSEDAAELSKFRVDLVDELQQNAKQVSACLRAVDGLTVVPPQGAMYLMIGIDPEFFDDRIESDVDFVRQLVQEEHVFVLPGSAFGAKNFVRVVICPPEPILLEACNRIKSFCATHRRITTS